MDILEFQNRLSAFMMSQVTNGPGNTKEAESLRNDLSAIIAEHGDTIPGLEDLAGQLDLLKELESNPELASLMSVQAMKDYVPNPQIFDAIDDGDASAVTVALAGWEINATHGEYESTALYHAMSCMFGVSLDVVNLLLDRGADPKLGLGTTSNVLHGLGFGRCDDVDTTELTKVIQRCVAKGADIEQRSNRLSWTPLITAASEWNPVAVEALILAGADIHARSGEVAGVCFSGEPARAFAVGHEATEAVFERFHTSH